MAVLPSFELPEEFTVRNAQSTLDTLKIWLGQDAVRNAQGVLLNASRVAEMDASALQILGALRQAGVPWCICDASDRFAKVCQITGLTQWLEPRAQDTVTDGAA